MLRTIPGKDTCMSKRDRFASAARTLQAFCLSVAAAATLALGAAQSVAFAADFTVSETARTHIPRTHGRVTKRVVLRGCIEVSQPPRGCPLWHYSRLPWPGLPTLAEPTYYPGGDWHRCWWGEWC
jgi:hypothetical protein